MHVTIDGHGTDVPILDHEKLEDVIKRISENLENGRCINRVHLDGADVTGSVLDRSSQVRNFASLEIETGSSRELALETLKSLEDFSQSMMQELTRTAEEFRLGDEDLSNQLFMRCLDGLQIMIRVTYSIGNLLEVDLREVLIEESNIPSLINRINELLDELIEAQTQNDTILLADLIEYELQPVLEDWMKAYHILKQDKSSVKI